MKILAERIKKRRKELRLNQGDLGELLGTNQTQVSRYETGENDPTAVVLLALAKALETTPNWLLGFDEEGIEG